MKHAAPMMKTAYGYTVLGALPDGTTMFGCLQEGNVVFDRHAHDDWHRALPFMAITTPELEDLMAREPASDFE